MEWKQSRSRSSSSSRSAVARNRPSSFSNPVERTTAAMGYHKEHTNAHTSSSAKLVQRFADCSCIELGKDTQSLPAQTPHVPFEHVENVTEIL